MTLTIPWALLVLIVILLTFAVFVLALGVYQYAVRVVVLPSFRFWYSNTPQSEYGVMVGSFPGFDHADFAWINSPHNVYRMRVGWLLFMWTKRSSLSDELDIRLQLGSLPRAYQHQISRLIDRKVEQQHAKLVAAESELRDKLYDAHRETDVMRKERDALADWQKNLLRKIAAVVDQPEP